MDIKPVNILMSERYININEFDFNQYLIEIY